MREIKLPSKTFLIGEYVALLGLPCLLITTPPYFLFHAVESTIFSMEGIPENSPADLFIKKYFSFFKNFKIKFSDPHQGAGGFGASSAQFLAVYLLKTGMDSHANSKDIANLLACYQEFAWNHQGLPPSGADIISQLTGDVTYFHKNKMQREKLHWTFDNVSYLLIKTHQKIPTHQHLQKLEKTTLVNLPDCADEAKNYLLKKNVVGLATCIKKFSDALIQHGLVHENTQIMLDEINCLPGVLASKGCGALGADVIFVMCEDEDAVKSWCYEKGIKFFN